MPVTRDVPKTLTELGRIRAGDQQANSSGKGFHPRSLTKWRLTSKSKAILEEAARLPTIGGTVRPWEGEQVQGVQWELYTETDTLDICLPTFRAVTMQFERWSTGGCQVRCDGQTVVHHATPELIGRPCLCPEDDQERTEQAKTGLACARILRINVLLPDLQGGLGFWRLETKGFYATSALLGMLELLRQAGAESTLIEATLRLEAREIKRPGSGALHFVVPVLTPTYTMRQIAQATRRQQGFLLHMPDAPLELPPAERAATAVDQLYGDGAGDVFRTPPPPPPDMATGHGPAPAEAVRSTTGTGVDTPPPPAAAQGSTRPVPGTAHAGQIYLDNIDALHRAHNHPDPWLSSYWGRVCRERGVTVRTELPVSVIVELHGKVKDYYAKEDGIMSQPPAPQTPTATEAQTSLALGTEPWRQSLQGLLEYCKDATLVQEAQALLEHPDTSTPDGEALLVRVQTVVQRMMGQDV